MRQLEFEYRAALFAYSRPPTPAVLNPISLRKRLSWKSADKQPIGVMSTHYLIMKTRADQVVLRYLKSDVTGDALRRAIFRYARALRTLGIDRGSLVAKFASNCPDALAIRYAVNLLGAGTTFLPALADADRRTILLERIQPTLLVVFAETAQLVPDAVKTRVVYAGAVLHLHDLTSSHRRSPICR
jgi:acyl-CoA synthetase (AMP-forming)/AMP-acid ligase II